MTYSDLILQVNETIEEGKFIWVDHVIGMGNICVNRRASSRGLWWDHCSAGVREMHSLEYSSSWMYFWTGVWWLGLATEGWCCGWLLLCLLVTNN